MLQLAVVDLHQDGRSNGNISLSIVPVLTLRIPILRETMPFLYFLLSVFHFLSLCYSLRLPNISTEAVKPLRATYCAAQ